MKKKNKEILISVIFSLLIITLLGGFIVSYLTSPKPILYSEGSCDSSLTGATTEFSFKVQNRAENTGLAQVCFKVDNAYFENNGSLIQQLCFSKSEISPKSAELEHTFTSDLVLNETDLDNGENITIETNVECSQKIWSLISRDCKDLSFKCVYKKEHSTWYTLVN